jgi:type IV secretion system protein VirD4
MEATLLMVSVSGYGVWPWNAIAMFYIILMLVMGNDSKAARLKAAKNPKFENAHGAAQFTEENAMLKKAGLLKGEGVPIGFTPDGKKALHYPGFGHLLTVAAARTGKGATLLVNALLSWRHSCIVIDPKCENALISSHFRRRFGKVYILNPFKLFPKELGSMQARFNPMDLIEVKSAAFHAQCDKLAASLVWQGMNEQQHWTDAARLLVSGIVAALMRHGDPKKRTLAEVARVVGSGEVFTFCRNAMQSTDPLIIQKLGRFTGKKVDENKEIGDVISTAAVQLGFIGNAAIAESLSGSDFRFSDVRKRRATVFICLPLSMMDTTSKYFRLVLETALTDLLNEGTQL